MWRTLTGRATLKVVQINSTIHVMSLQMLEIFYINCKEKREVDENSIRGHPLSTYAKISGFLTPTLPFVRVCTIWRDPP